MPTKSKRCTPERFSAVVIVPVYNRAALLTRCLDSIHSQSFRPLTLVIADNNSTDRSAEIAGQWAESHRADDFAVSVINAPEQGAAAARQHGLDSLGDFGRDSDTILFFFDSDDTMRPDMISTAMRTFNDTDANLLCWNVAFHGLDGKTRITRDPDAENTLAAHLVHGSLATQRFAVNARFLADAGAWNTGIDVWDDWELGIRLLLADPHFCCTDQVLADVFSQRESITGTSFTARAGRWENVLTIAASHLKNAPAKIRHLIPYRQAVLAAHYHREGNKTGAKALLKKALDTPGLSTLNRLGLRLTYTHTALGLRGAHTIFGHLL